MSQEANGLLVEILRSMARFHESVANELCFISSQKAEYKLLFWVHMDIVVIV